MFGRRYFGGRHFGARYFGQGGTGVPPDHGPVFPPGGDISINDVDRRRRIEDEDLLAVVVGFLIASRGIR